MEKYSGGYGGSQRLAGLATVVTGSSWGIGRSIALAYALEGASVLCVDTTPFPPANITPHQSTVKCSSPSNGDNKNKNNYDDDDDSDTIIMKPTHEEILGVAQGERSAFFPVNPYSNNQIANAITKCVELFGRVDVVVNNPAWMPFKIPNVISSSLKSTTCNLSQSVTSDASAQWVDLDVCSTPNSPPFSLFKNSSQIYTNSQAKPHSTSVAISDNTDATFVPNKLDHNLENIWSRHVKEVHDDNDGTSEELGQKILSLLNRITPEKFIPVSNRIIGCFYLYCSSYARTNYGYQSNSEYIKYEVVLQRIIDLIIEKAKDEEIYTEMYAKLLRQMMLSLCNHTLMSGMKAGIFIRTCLRRLYHLDYQDRLEDQKTKSPKTTTVPSIFSNNYFEKVKETRQRKGMMILVAELYANMAVPFKVVRKYMNYCLRYPCDETIQCMCKMLAIIGPRLYREHKKEISYNWLEELKKFTMDNRDKAFGMLTTMMIKDIIKASYNDWEFRFKPHRPKTLTEVHKEAKFEQKKIWNRDETTEIKESLSIEPVVTSFSTNIQTSLEDQPQNADTTISIVDANPHSQQQKVKQANNVDKIIIKTSELNVGTSMPSLGNEKVEKMTTKFDELNLDNNSNLILSKKKQHEARNSENVEKVTNSISDLAISAHTVTTSTCAKTTNNLSARANIKLGTLEQRERLSQKSNIARYNPINIRPLRGSTGVNIRFGDGINPFEKFNVPISHSITSKKRQEVGNKRKFEKSTSSQVISEDSEDYSEGSGSDSCDNNGSDASEDGEAADNGGANGKNTVSTKEDDTFINITTAARKEVKSNLNIPQTNTDTVESLADRCNSFTQVPATKDLKNKIKHEDVVKPNLMMLKGDISQLPPTALEPDNNIKEKVNHAIAEEAVGEFDQIIATGLRAVWIGTKTAIEQMLLQELTNFCSRGKIINISSIGAQIGLQKSPAACASDAGIVGLTKQVALDYAHKKINVNAICVGNIKDDNKVPSMFMESDVGGWPEKGTAGDVAMAAVFLGSDESRFCTGSVLTIDGGYSAH